MAPHGGEEFHDLFPLVLCLALAIWLGHIVHVRRIAFLTEATVSLLVGLVAGGGVVAYFILWRGLKIPKSLTEFNTEVFFDALLPPIIFNAGFSAKKKSFFRNFVTLTLFGVVGTFMTAAMISMGCNYTLSFLGLDAHLLADSLALGTVFSSSDSVAALQILDADESPMLYSLVFGEGVVNDATSIVLLRAVQKISKSSQLTGDTLLLIMGNFVRLFILSLVLGIGVGLASAFLIKRTFVHHSTDREVTLVGLLGFLAYLGAEELGLSGIFSVFFCGITMSHYTWHALSPSAKVVTVYLFRIISFTSELFLFLYAGFSMWSSALWQSDVGEESLGQLVKAAGTLSAALVVLVLAARALTIAPLAVLANVWRPPGCRISAGQGAVIWWSGSMRGAITVAMAFKTFNTLPGASKAAARNYQKILVASNAAVIFFTVVMGGVTSRLLAWFLSGEEDDGGMEAMHSTVASYRSFDDAISAPLLAGALQRHLHWGKKSPVYRAWHRLDENWLRPLFGGRAPQAYSPPPSPGRQIITQVLGPSILKRLTPVPTDRPQVAANGSGPVVSAAAVAAAAAAAAPPSAGGPGSARPHSPATGRPPRHPDPFRLWPAPSDSEAGGSASQELAAAGAGAAPGTGTGTAGSERGATRAHSRASLEGPRAAAAPAPRAVSRRGSMLRPEAAEMHPADALEELFATRSDRLDSNVSQPLNWEDSAEFGEAAFLAAGAPDVQPGSRSRSPHPGQQQEEQGEQDASPAAAGQLRRSPFQQSRSLPRPGSGGGDDSAV